MVVCSLGLFLVALSYLKHLCNSDFSAEFRLKSILFSSLLFRAILSIKLHDGL